MMLRMIGQTRMKTKMTGKMNKKIVLFGTDNSGKTTLGKALAEEIGGIYLPPLGPTSLGFQISYLDVSLNQEGILIFDRFPVIEEEVCGNVFRGGSNFENVPYDQYIDAVDMFVFCNPGLEAILNWGEREQMSGVKEKIISLYAGYSLWFKKLKDAGKNVIEYNWKVAGDYARILEGVLG